MAHVHRLKINNFRGITDLTHTFGKRKFICLIGRGDSGKSTILEAISLVLSPQWNISFHDSDFSNCDTSHPIVIEATLTELPDKLLDEEKFGTFIRGIKKDGLTVTDEVEEIATDALTIRLIVEKDLQPQWLVVNERQEPKIISASDRSKLNTFLVSDYLDRHFSWARGNPLYALFKKENVEEDDEENAIIEALRNAKKAIDGHPFTEFTEVINKVKAAAQILGLDVSKTKNTIDVKDLFVSDGKVSLHDGKIPFRLKGKGSKRLLSIAIQTALIVDGGVMLIDEVEQGLEPDRAQNLVRRLKSDNRGQIFITTHSRDVLVELETGNLCLVKIGGKQLTDLQSNLQGSLRKNPEAFFATKVLVCEGATEIGICRALDKHKILDRQKGASYSGVRFVDGEGQKIIDYCKGFKDCDYVIALFCDSDIDKESRNKGVMTKDKESLRKDCIVIFDWNAGDSLEEAVVNDLPYEGLKEFLSLAYKLKQSESNTDPKEIKDGIRQAISSKFGKACPAGLTAETDTPELRKAIGLAAKSGEWFKNQSKGEAMGELLIKYYPQLKGDSKLKEVLNNLSVFIDGTKLS
jgi:putative ATP-dependent endonuclease of the OLD family